MNNNSITGFLLGTIVTLIFKEVFNQYSKNQEFKRDLKKLTFQKKLKKAEKVIAWYYVFLEQIIGIRKSFEFVISALKEIETGDMEITPVMDLAHQAQTRLHSLSDEKHYDMRSAHLYFEYEDNNEWNEKNYENLIKSAIELHSCDDKIQFWLSSQKTYISNNETDKANFCFEKAKSLVPDSITAMVRFISLLNINQVEAENTISKIKGQLKIK